MDRVKRQRDAFSENREQNRILLEKYREAAAARNIPASLPRLARASEAELVMRRRKMRMMRAYATHLFTNMASGMQDCDSAFLLLDPDGCVVQLHARGDFETFLSRKGIVLGSVWRPDVMGSDAICVGNTERAAMQSAGSENYLWALQDLALYYAPLQIMEKGVAFTNMGGLAWICPLSKQSDAYMLTAAGMASALNIRVSTAWNTSDSYEGDARGVAQLDINTKNGRVALTHHNRKLFDVLETEPMTRWECYFKPADELFDPLPANARLWDIISSQTDVHEQEMTIQVHGRRLNRVITTVATAHPELKSKGIQLFITTRKDISHQVAGRTGNNAVISFQDVIGGSTIMKNRVKRAKLLANTESNIMILGESGVGKDVFAQAIHNQSHRRSGPFVSVNCGALPRDLIASELFGYDAGAFTGAKKQGNIGKFELAEGGTLFLDEIGEMPLDLQTTLLRAVEQKQFMRLGSSRVIKADVRIISATNVDINRMISEKRFRSDLYYRLSTMSMDLPPLRERGEDIILLAEYFIRKISRKIGRQDIMELTPESKDFLRACPWQGNVRELQNLIDCLVQLYPDHMITPDLIRENINPAYFEEYKAGYANMAAAPVSPQTPQVPEQRELFGAGNKPAEQEITFPEAEVRNSGGPVNAETDARRDLTLLTKEEILEALEVCEGNRSKAAKYLSVGRRTLYRYIDRFGIGDKQYNK